MDPLDALPTAARVMIRGEDEIAPIGPLSGAARAGEGTMITTSVPWMSLLGESVGLVIVGGVPLAIVRAPAPVPDCRRPPRRAFALVRRRRYPVFVPADEELALTVSTVEGEADEPLAPKGARLPGAEPGEGCSATARTSASEGAWRRSGAAPISEGSIIQPLLCKKSGYTDC